MGRGILLWMLGVPLPIILRGGPTNLDRFRGRDKWNSAGYAAAASG
jgi:hypothetical protein